MSFKLGHRKRGSDQSQNPAKVTADDLCQRHPKTACVSRLWTNVPNSRNTGIWNFGNRSHSADASLEQHRAINFAIETMIRYTDELDQPTRFFTTSRYFRSFSMPTTFEAPLSSPAASIVPDPANMSSRTPLGGRMYRHYQAARS